MRARIWAEYIGFRGIAAILSALPVETASNLTAALWRAVAPLLKRHARARAHLARAFPEKSPAERERIAREMWGHLGRTFAETFHLDALGRQGRVTMEAQAQLEAVREGGPYVVCGLHLGNWEIGGVLSTGIGRPIAGVYQPLSNPLVDAELQRLRAPLYPLGLFPRSPRPCAS